MLNTEKEHKLKKKGQNRKRGWQRSDKPASEAAAEAGKEGAGGSGLRRGGLNFLSHALFH